MYKQGDILLIPIPYYRVYYYISDQKTRYGDDGL